MCWKFVGVTVCAFLVGHVCQARDLFVNNLEGDDAQEGRAPRTEGRDAGPMKTIAAAMRRAHPGDHVILANTGEPYREAITIQAARNSGTSDRSPFVLEGNGAVIDGSIPIEFDAWESFKGDVFRYAPTVKSRQVLLLGGQPAVRVPLARDAISLPDLKPLEYCLSNGYIYFRVEEGQTPQSYDPACAGEWTGITLYDVQNVVVRNVIVRGFAFDGLNAHDDVFNGRFEGVLARDNGRSGFSIGGASRVKLTNCEATHNHEAQLRTEGFSITKIVDCKLDPTTAPAQAIEGGRLIEGE